MTLESIMLTKIKLTLSCFCLTGLLYAGIDCSDHFENNFLTCAAAQGHVKVFKEVFSHPFCFFFDREIMNSCCCFAAANGHLEVLDFLFTEAFPQNSLCFFDQEILNNCCMCAAAHGRIEVLHFLFKKIIPHSFGCIDANMINHCCFFALHHGHRHVLDFFSKEVFPLCPFSFRFCIE